VRVKGVGQEIILNYLRLDVAQIPDYQGDYWGLCARYRELEADLDCVVEDFWFLLDLFQHIADLLHAEGYCLGCEIPCEDLAEGESACDLLEFEKVEPLPTRPKHLKVVK
jgi:hypothetical protein